MNLIMRRLCKGWNGELNVFIDDIGKTSLDHRIGRFRLIQCKTILSWIRTQWKAPSADYFQHAPMDQLYGSAVEWNHPFQLFENSIHRFRLFQRCSDNSCAFT